MDVGKSILMLFGKLRRASGVSGEPSGQSFEIFGRRLAACGGGRGPPSRAILVVLKDLKVILARLKTQK